MFLRKYPFFFFCNTKSICFRFLWKCCLGGFCQLPREFPKSWWWKERGRGRVTFLFIIVLFLERGLSSCARRHADLSQQMFCSDAPTNPPRQKSLPRNVELRGLLLSCSGQTLASWWVFPRVFFFGAVGVGRGGGRRVGLVVGEAAMEALQESQMCSCPPHVGTLKSLFRCYQFSRTVKKPAPAPSLLSWSLTLSCHSTWYVRCEIKPPLFFIIHKMCWLFSRWNLQTLATFVQKPDFFWTLVFKVKQYESAHQDLWAAVLINTVNPPEKTNILEDCQILILERTFFKGSHHNGWELNPFF